MPLPPLPDGFRVEIVDHRFVVRKDESVRKKGVGHRRTGFLSGRQSRAARRNRGSCFFLFQQGEIDFLRRGDDDDVHNLAGFSPDGHTAL